MAENLQQVRTIRNLNDNLDLLKRINAEREKRSDETISSKIAENKLSDEGNNPMQLEDEQKNGDEEYVICSEYVATPSTEKLDSSQKDGSHLTVHQPRRKADYESDHSDNQEDDRRRDKRKDIDCRYFLENRCTRVRCHFLHDPEKQKTTHSQLSRPKTSHKDKNVTGNEDRRNLEKEFSRFQRSTEKADSCNQNHNSSFLQERGVDSEQKDTYQKDTEQKGSDNRWKKVLCKFYMQGRCRHTRDGTKCNFYHPPERQKRSPQRHQKDGRETRNVNGRDRTYKDLLLIPNNKKEISDLKNEVHFLENRLKKIKRYY